MTDRSMGVSDSHQAADGLAKPIDYWAMRRVEVASEGQGASFKKLRVAVVIATRGREDILVDMVARLDRQTVRPDSITISCSKISDVGVLAQRSDINIILTSAGLPRQRNAALLALDPATEVVVFFDDDFIAHPLWIEMAELRFRVSPDVAGLTGHVVADGIKGPGLSVEEADAQIEKIDGRDAGWIHENCSPYGCNMAFRYSAISGLFFDERLVLYGWLEDRDFGGALAKRGGRMLKLGTACGVHLGTKRGRVSGKKLGYSQVVNPIYMHRKGTMTFRSLTKHLVGNVGRNLLGTFFPEPHIDRFGRLRGNLVGIANVLQGSAAPEHAERL